MSRYRRLADWWVTKWAGEKLRREGPVRTLAAAPRFAYREFVAGKPRRHALLAAAGPTLDRAALKQRTGEAERLWHHDEEEYFRLEDDRAGLPAQFSTRLGSYRAERPFVCELRDATLVGPEPFALTTDRRPVIETTDANRRYLYFRLESLVGERSTPRSLATVARRVRFAPRAGGAAYDYDCALPMVKYHGTTFYHWMLEYLPRLRGLERYREATGRTPTVLVPPDPPGWLTETMRLVGWPMDRVEEWDPDAAPATVRRLVVPMHRKRVMGVPRTQHPDDYNPSLDDLEWLQDRFHEATPDELFERDWPDRIYVSRERAQYNRAENEADLVATLEDYGFESVVAEAHSLPEQVAMFAGCEAVVAPHGSGLVNLVHAQGDPTVIELFREDNVRAFYYCLARELGLEYHWLTGETVDTDMRVDPDELGATVERVLD